MPTDAEFRDRAEAKMRAAFGLDGTVAKYGSVARVQSGAYVETTLYLPNPAPKCASCGSANTTEAIKMDYFDYGVGPEAERLSAEVPVVLCFDCAFSFTDERGEEARTRAVAQALARKK